PTTSDIYTLPYTTLFRSAREQRGPARAADRPRIRPGRHREGDPLGSRAIRIPGRVLAPGRGGPRLDGADSEDLEPRREAGRLLRSEEHTSELQSPDHLVC